MVYLELQVLYTGRVGHVSLGIINHPLLCMVKVPLTILKTILVPIISEISDATNFFSDDSH